MRERGQAIVEFALITPLIILLLFMIVDVGILLIRRATLEDAVRQGATESAAGVAVATVQAYTSEQSMGLVDADSVVVCMVDDSHVRVSSSYAWRWLSGPLVARLGGEGLTDVVLHPSADRRLEAAVTPDAPPCP